MIRREVLLHDHELRPLPTSTCPLHGTMVTFVYPKQSNGETTTISMTDLVSTERLTTGSNERPLSISPAGRLVSPVGRLVGPVGRLVNPILANPRLANPILVNPINVPVSPTTRLAANQHSRRGSSIINMYPIKLPAFMNCELIGIVPQEDSCKYQLIIVIDCVKSTKIKLLRGDKKRNLLGTVELVNPGMNIFVEFNLVMKKLPSSSLYYHVICEPLSEKITSSTPVHKTIIEVKSENGILVPRATKQFVIYGTRTLEILEIYGQVGESTPPNSFITKDSVNDSFVSISIGEDHVDEERPECVICLSSPRTTLFMPCRHLCVCAACGDSLLGENAKCPICRQAFSSLITVTEGVVGCEDDKGRELAQ